MAQTDQNGLARFVVDLATSRDYVASVSAVPAGYLLPSPASQDVLALNAGETRTVTFVAQRATATVDVFVRDASGQPVPGAEVFFQIR